MNISLKRFATVIAISIIFTATISYFVYGLTPTTTFIISEGYYPSSFDYSVYYDPSGGYYIKDKRGLIAASSTIGVAGIINGLLSNGQTWFFGQGVFLVEEPINISGLKNIHLFGSSRNEYLPSDQSGTILELDANVNNSLIQCINPSIQRNAIEIDHFHFNGTYDKQSGGGILYFKYSSWNSIHDNSFWGAYAGKGIYSDAHIEQMQIDNNIFVGCGIEAKDLLGSRITRNSIMTAGNCDGIYVYGTSSNSGNIITDNDIYSEFGYGTTGSGLDLADFDDSIISNNVIYQNAHEGISFYSRCENNTITGNVIYDNGYLTTNHVGIYLYDFGSNATQNSKNIIANNILYDSGSGYQDYGIRVSANNYYNTVIGNNAFGGTANIYIESGSNTEVHSCWNGTTWIT